MRNAAIRGKRHRPSWRYGLILLCLSGLLLAGTVAIYLMILRTSFDFPNFFVTASVFTLLVFLAILIVRYLFLMWFAFLDYLDPWVQGDPQFMPLVSIIVPAYNEERVIGASLASLVSLHYPKYEVILVDDGSTDDTYRRALRWHGEHRGVKVKVMHQPNGGKAVALNTGIRHAHGEILVCVDADSQLTERALFAMVQHFKDPAVGAVAGNVKARNRDRFLTELQALEYIEGLNMVRRSQGFFRIVNIIPGPCGAFRRSAVGQVGGYDPNIFAEDCELTIKLLIQGWKVKYEGRAISYTEVPEGFKDLIKQRYRWTRGILQSLRKHHRYFTSIRGGIGTTFALWYLAFESILWPFMNVFGNAFLLFVAFAYGFSALLVFWWIQLTLLDLTLALFCVAMEREDLKLVLYSAFYRLWYILSLDVCKLLAALDEVRRASMVWGKADRVGV